MSVGPCSFVLFNLEVNNEKNIQLFETHFGSFFNSKLV